MGPAAGDASKPRLATLRARAADSDDFARYVLANLSRGGLYLANPRPPPAGAHIILEVVSRAGEVRICAAHVVVEQSFAAPDGNRAPGIVVRIVRVEPGCDEELRRVLGAGAAAIEDKKAPARKGPIVGIDLGTTFSCVAVAEAGGPRVIASRLGYSTIPSVVTFDDRGLPVVGQPAERRMVLEPDHVIYGSKRFIGRPFSAALVEQFAEHMQYEIVPDSQGMAAVRVAGRLLSPIEVGACILAEVRAEAELELHRPITHAVITVPAYFSTSQRRAVREAAQRAGLHVARIVNEPTAAALAYGHGRAEQKKVLVYDLGGGTFDVSILEIVGSVYTVLATAGDTFLGGLDFDRLLAAHLAGELGSKHGATELNRVSQERLLMAAREAKHVLSTTTRANVQLPRLRIGDKDLDFQVAITREQLEALVAPLIARTVAICDQAMAAAKLAPRDIGEVLLVGGQTRMPIIHQKLQAHFGRAPSKRVHPDEVVALGAALLASSFEQEDSPTLVDVLPIPIGVALPTGMLQRVFAHNTALPATARITLEAPPGRPLEVAVFQGEASHARENEFLGSCVYNVQVPAGASRKVELLFMLSTECLLSIRGKIVATGEERLDRLTTQQTSDEVLASIGGERVRPAHKDSATQALRTVATAAKAPAKKPGFWSRLLGKK